MANDKPEIRFGIGTVARDGGQAVAVACFFLKTPDAEQHYGAGMFSRAYRRARDIQTSSFRNFFTRWV